MLSWFRVQALKHRMSLITAGEMLDRVEDVGLNGLTLTEMVQLANFHAIMTRLAQSTDALVQSATTTAVVEDDNIDQTGQYL